MGAAGRGATALMATALMAAALLAAALLLAGCTGSGGDRTVAGPTTPETTPQRAPASTLGSGVADTTTLTCANSIDGDAAPGDYTVVLGAVALPASPGHPALQAAGSGESGPVPRLFAKTGLVVRAGVASEIDVPDSVDPHVGIGWTNGPVPPSRRFVVPVCPDARGTGWLAYPGGYWVDTPLCLPLDVRVGDQVQRVEVGVGKACAGQSPPPTP